MGFLYGCYGPTVCTAQLMIIIWNQLSSIQFSEYSEIKEKFLLEELISMLYATDRIERLSEYLQK